MQPGNTDTRRSRADNTDTKRKGPLTYNFKCIVSLLLFPLVAERLDAICKFAISFSAHDVSVLMNASHTADSTAGAEETAANRRSGEGRAQETNACANQTKKWEKESSSSSMCRIEEG
jgi:hypothetical protein